MNFVLCGYDDLFECAAIMNRTMAENVALFALNCFGSFGLLYSNVVHVHMRKKVKTKMNQCKKFDHKESHKQFVITFAEVGKKKPMSCVAELINNRSQKLCEQSATNTLLN